ncbi:MAG TPA: hypothetical protein PLN38_16860 [Chitinophagales bacterium]|nr:hypothetical protein [Chitinophagales bacterium]
MNTINKIEFTRINNDTCGNPRYVCWYGNLLTDAEVGYHNGVEYVDGSLPVSDRYHTAIKRANKLGGRKFHNKQYGGGIVFQSYNIQDLEQRIHELVQNS